MGAPSSHGGDDPCVLSHRRNRKLSALLRGGLRLLAKSSNSTSIALPPLQRGPGRWRRQRPTLPPSFERPQAERGLASAVFVSGPLGTASSIITSAHSPWQRMALARQFASRIAKSLDQNGVIMRLSIRMAQPCCSLITWNVIIVCHREWTAYITRRPDDRKIADPFNPAENGPR